MVSSLSIIFMVISLIISLALPIGGIIYLKKKYKASLKIFFIGMLSFFISVQILEAPIHSYFLSINKTTSELECSEEIRQIESTIFSDFLRITPCFKFF